MSDYKQEQIQKQEKRNNIMKALHEALKNEGWSFKVVENEFLGTQDLKLQHETGAELYIYTDYKGKVEMGGSSPRDSKGSMYNLKIDNISFNPDKEMNKIVKDCIRRYIQPYLEAYKAKLEEVKKINEHIQKQNDLEQSIEKVIGGYKSLYKDGYSINAESRYRGSLHIELTLYNKEDKEELKSMLNKLLDLVQ